MSRFTRLSLRSTSVLLNQDGTVAKREFYYPYGGNRGTAFSDLTTRRFTGQYHEQALPAARAWPTTTLAGMTPPWDVSSRRIRWSPVQAIRRTSIATAMCGTIPSTSSTRQDTDYAKARVIAVPRANTLNCGRRGNPSRANSRGISSSSAEPTINATLTAPIFCSRTA